MFSILGGDLNPDSQNNLQTRVLTSKLVGIFHKLKQCEHKMKRVNLVNLTITKKPQISSTTRSHIGMNGQIITAAYTLSFMPSSQRNEQYNFRNCASFLGSMPSFRDGEWFSISCILKYHLRAEHWGSSGMYKLIASLAIPCWEGFLRNCSDMVTFYSQGNKRELWT